MRKINCKDMHGVTVEEVLEEFNERSDEFGIVEESDIISISIRPATKPRNIAQPGGKLLQSEVVVTFIYWENV